MPQPRVKRVKLTPINDNPAVPASKPPAESNLPTSTPVQTVESTLLLPVMPPVLGNSTEKKLGKSGRANDVVATTSMQPESTEEDYIYLDADVDAEDMYTEALKFLQRSLVPLPLPLSTLYQLALNLNFTYSHTSRFIATFDEDRSDLASAYSCNALFSYRLHKPPNAGADAPAAGLERFASRPTSRTAPGSSSEALNT